MKLNGASSVDIEYGSTYAEQYATATYGKKDISSSINVSGNVDTSKVGSYKITYTATHKQKTKSITRTVEEVDGIASLDDFLNEISNPVPIKQKDEIE